MAAAVQEIERAADYSVNGGASRNKEGVLAYSFLL